jgi:tetratricopeptide repeat protein
MTKKGTNYMMRRLLFITTAALGIAFNAVADVSPELAEAYSEKRWSKVRRMLDNSKDSPDVKLVRAYYNLNARTGDKDTGLQQLRELLKNKQTPEDVRLQADYTYARTINLMQMRPDLYPEAQSLGNPNDIYARIIKNNPASAEACRAVVFQARSIMKDDSKKAFNLLEQFLSEPKRRNKRFIGIVHWYAANEYIARKRDYNKAIGHLLATESFGLANPRYMTSIRFQIGRIFDIKLNNPEKATVYYKRFIKRYPTSILSLMAKRCLREMQLKGAKK